MMRKRQARELPSSSTKIRSIIQLDQADEEGVQWAVCDRYGGKRKLLDRVIL